MGVSAMLKVMSLTLLVTLCWGQGQDAALSAGAYGFPVVNSVVSRIRSNCIFSEDRLFLRRTAYVMSRDGRETATYRNGFDGGIWQVTEAMFEATTNCSQPSIKTACDNIASKLQIHWPAVKWSDLRKPLYSGLAAALYTLKTLGTSDMPGNISSQAPIWAQVYGQSASVYVTKAAQAPVFECKDKLDLAFILDSSGSVSVKDFGLMKQFAAHVVDVMNVSQDAIRIADIVYASTVQVFFAFNDYHSKAAVKRKLLNTMKFGSTTNTAGALTLARTTLYDGIRGARENVKKVAVLVTDGMSNSRPSTERAAKLLKDEGTTVFAIGVGGYNLAELQAVASYPICSHVFTMDSFDKIDSIITEIQKSTCEANHKLTESKPIKGELTEEPSVTTTETTTPDPDKTIEAKVSCGILNIYVSTKDPKPGPEVFDELYTASPGAPTVLRTVETLSPGTPVYVTVVGTRLPSSMAALSNCSDYSWEIAVEKKKYITVVCKENGVERACTKADINYAGVCPKDKDVNYPVKNPCTQENLDKGIMRFSYPYDPTKFLQCDKQGKYYITPCPGGAIYNAETRECGFSSPGSSDTQESNSDGQGDGREEASPVTPVPPVGIASVCTSQALKKHQFYHTYQADPKKFIQCDAWGNAYLMPCGPNTVWSQTAYTCVHAPKRARAADAASTTEATILMPSCQHDQLYVFPGDRHKFYICNYGRLHTKICPPGLVFNLSAKMCDWPQGSSSAPKRTHSANADKAATTEATILMPSCQHDQLYDFPGDRHKFYICNYGRLHTKICPPGLVFKLDAQLCDWPPLPSSRP
ncbi:uncharacterized protein LOC143289845 [Babylonia areolata]|uniref:uncharacterized protein LOC143289845 n=1 Tax=Babylonia areolata TaxID=304850 RepID=UPI003FD12FB7